MITRDYAWKLSDTHPYWKRRTRDKCPKCGDAHPVEENKKTRLYSCSSCKFKWISWEGDQLTFLVVMQTGKQIDDWVEDKLSPFFTSGEIDIETKGGIKQSIRHKETGNKIILFSHDNATEVRKRLQYFVAHDAWVDEMPGSYKVYEEVMQRIRAKMGQTSFTLTPKVSNISVMKFIDGLSPDIHTLYRMTLLDNPIYEGREEEELKTYESYTEAMRNAALYGDWVFDANLRLNVKIEQIKPLPDHYSRTWDHVVSIDPATTSATGLTIFAKDPVDTYTWWVVLSRHIGAAAPTQLIKEEIPKYISGINIVKRIADPAAAWFVMESAEHGIHYDSPFDKTHRRRELLAQAETALVNPNMFFAEGSTDQLISEFNEAEEDPNKPEEIKKAQKYHGIDSFLYGLDLLPKYTTPPKPMTAEQELKHAWYQQEMGEKTELSTLMQQLSATSAKPKVGNSFKKMFGGGNRTSSKSSMRWQRRR